MGALKLKSELTTSSLGTVPAVIFLGVDGKKYVHLEESVADAETKANEILADNDLILIGMVDALLPKNATPYYSRN